MAYPRLNTRSIRLFVATPEELAKRRPNLHSVWFRISKAEIDRAFAISGGGDIVATIGVWKRDPQDGKPPYYTAEISYPDDADKMRELVAKDRAWEDSHPRTVNDQQRRRTDGAGTAQPQVQEPEPDPYGALPF